MQTPREFSWDPRKSDINLAARGIGFAAAADFAFDTAVVAIDDRKDYGELREVAAGFIDTRLHILVFTMRGQVCHVISLRKANRREVQAYVDQT